MALTNVWLRTLADGLVRADQVVGVYAHPTPAGAGKPSHWLLDVVVPTNTGAGQNDSWVVGALHRTVIQTDQEPVDAGENLVRLLAQLDVINASGTVTASVGAAGARPSATEVPTGVDNGAITTVRFRFTPFRATEPGRNYDPEYL
jgi:hypothetical protein